MAVQIRPLNREEISTQSHVLGKAASLINAKPPLSAPQIQQIYDKLRAQYDHADHVNGVGVALGELIIGRTNFEWAKIAFDGGYETCVFAPGTQVFCTPLSMVTKRLIERQPVNIADLCEATIATMYQRLNRR